MWFWYQCDTSWRFPPSAIFWKNLQMIAVSSSLDDKFAFEAIWSWNFVLWKLLNYGSGSDGKESACNAGDLCSVPELRQSHEEENGYPLQCSYLENSKESTRAPVHWINDAFQPSHLLSSPSPAFNLSQNQALFQWVISSHQVAKGLELQL